MTIDEAIEMYKKIANTDSNCPRYCMNPCEDCVKECKQIAEYLEELKEYKKNSNTCPMCDTYCSYLSDEFENGYNKAIDDFVERLTTYLGIENATKYGNKNAEQMRNSYGTFMNYEIAESIEDVAEQLKAGEK